MQLKNIEFVFIIFDIAVHQICRVLISISIGIYFSSNSVLTFVINACFSFFYVYKFPAILTEQFISFHALNYFLLGNSAIMFTTILPIIMINFLYKKILYKKILIPCLVSFCLVYFLSINFNGIGWQGGGINYFFSQKIFHNNIYFYFASFFTISAFIYLSIENKSNSIILITLLFMFFSYQVYQRYYDPMFFIVFFLLVKTNLTKIFFKKKIACYLLLVYFILFYLGTVSKLLYKL
jgi:hypothetical protein